MDQGKKDYEIFLSGDDSGLAEIIRNYKDGMIFYLNSFVHNLFIAEELTEEVFVKLVIKNLNLSLILLLRLGCILLVVIQP